MFQVSNDIPIERQSYHFAAPSQRVGVLMLHGFMGSPRTSLALGHYLHERGLTVYCPLLTGHGHMPARLHRVSHKTWLTEAEAGLAKLRTEVDTIFLVGHSMGCVNGGHLAANNPDLAGFVALAPLVYPPERAAIGSLALLRHVVKFIYPMKLPVIERAILEERVLEFLPHLDVRDPVVQKWMVDATKLPTSALDEMRKMAAYGRKLWPGLQLPMLILQGMEDEAIKPPFARMIFDSILSAKKTIAGMANNVNATIQRALDSQKMSRRNSERFKRGFLAACGKVSAEVARECGFVQQAIVHEFANQIRQ